MQAINLEMNDLFTEATSYGYVWQFEGGDTDGEVIARRVLSRNARGWQLLPATRNERMNPHATVELF